MYAASRIILALKRQNEGYEDTRKLSEEEPVSISVQRRPHLTDVALLSQAARVMTVTITYSRNILLAGERSLSFASLMHSS